jgi:drug/metabolite transporter (DMT)-like permease
MAVALWIAAALVVADTLFLVSRVGRPRGPVAPSTAVIAIVQYGAIAGLLVWSAVNR